MELRLLSCRVEGPEAVRSAQPDTPQLPPLELGEGEDKLVLTGVADRVDGWLHEGKLYLRVVDYKTGRKKFDLSDVLYGMNLQMLLYLLLHKYNSYNI